MSIKVMSRVWETSQQKQNARLLLLALADNANDDGWAWPSIETLAEKVNVTKRSIQRLLDTLEADNEIVIYNRVNVKQPEHHYSNVYHLSNYSDAKTNPPQLIGELKKRPGSDNPVTGGSDTDDTTWVVTTASLGSDNSVTGVVTRVSPESLLNHHRTEKEKDSSADALAHEFSMLPFKGVGNILERPEPTHKAWWGAVNEVWGYTDKLAGEMVKMLKGESKHPAFKDTNLDPPLMHPDELLQWAAWYRRTELDNNPSLNMLENRMKIQSSIGQWRAIKQTRKSKIIPQHVLDKYRPKPDDIPFMSGSKPA